MRHSPKAVRNHSGITQVALKADSRNLLRSWLTRILYRTIKVDPAGLKQTKWHEYALRFVASGIITVRAGVIARKWGPGIGGLFLAFPAIFPATVTLIEKHERQRKQSKDLHGEDVERIPPLSTPSEPQWGVSA